MRKMKICINIMLLGLIFLTGCLFDSCSDSSITKIEKVAAPAFTVTRGTAYDVVLSSNTEGAAIKYTIDESDPSSSESAVAGNNVTIDLYTTIKAYAYKDGIEDSCIVSFQIPLCEKSKFVKYDPDNADLKVNSYRRDQYDGNDNKIREIWYNNIGTDNKWFTEDDGVDYYYLNTCNSENQQQKAEKYTGAGADGEWLTADDVLDSSKIFDYNGAELSKISDYDNADQLQSYTTFKDTDNDNLIDLEERFDAVGTRIDYDVYDYGGDNILDRIDTKDDGDNLLSYYLLVYNADQLTTKTLYNAADVVQEVGTYAYTENMEGSFKYVYDNNRVSTKTYRIGYGEDTDDYYIKYEYNADGKIIKETKYNGTGDDHIWQTNDDTEVAYWEYQYSDGQIEKTYYKDGVAGEFYRYTYNAGNQLIKTERFNQASDNAAQEYILHSYNGNNQLIKEDVYVNPGSATKLITYNITIQAGVSSTGYYTLMGFNFDLNGNPVGNPINLSSDYTAFIKNYIEKINYIIDNVKMTDAGYMVNGTNGGKCIIVYTFEEGAVNYLNLEFTFTDFDNNDGYIYNGVLTKKIEGAISSNGTITGTFDGTFTGEISITETDPQWEESDFILDAYVVSEYVNNNLDKEIRYKDPGEDAQWNSGIDTIDYFCIYNYDNVVLTQLNNKEYFNADNQLTHRIDYTYGVDGVDTESTIKEFGEYILYKDNGGVDLYSTFEYNN